MNAAAQPMPRHPLLVAGSVMVASLLYSIDWTIAVVALPHMQGTFSATQDQVAWVITSYIVASAIMIPASGWLADRFGRKRVFVSAVASFTAASVLCGAANSLSVEVVARILQGMSGAFLIPLSLSIILDTFPEEQHAKAMAYWGIGSVCGAVFGPTIGGYLTEYFSWRYIFSLNIPFGLLALIGVLLFLPETERDPKKKLDWFGFLTLAIGIGALQMMLDRGQRLDWFESGEIIFEASLAAISLYMFNMHVLTHREPFLDPRVFLQRNFFVALIMISFYGLLTVPPMVLMPTFLETVRGYSIDTVAALEVGEDVGPVLAYGDGVTLHVHERGSHRHQQRTGDQRQYAEVLRLEQRRPLGAGEELPRRHFAEEADRFPQQHEYDPDRSEDRYGPAGEEHAMIPRSFQRRAAENASVCWPDCATVELVAASATLPTYPF